MKSLGLTPLFMVVSALGAWAQPAPDFALIDMNNNSVRTGQVVSPRDYLFQVSGYYFGTAS